MVQLFSMLGTDIINLSLSKGKKIATDFNDPLISDVGNNYIGHILGMTVLIWFPFYCSYIYLRRGEIFKL